MRSDAEQELFDSFSEVSAIGQELAVKFNEWNEGNVDENKEDDCITPDMSGDTVISYYKDKGFEEDNVYKILKSVGFSPSEDSDDTVVSDIDIKKPREISEKINEFIEQCVAVSSEFTGLVKEVELQEGNSQRKEEVRIVIPSDGDIRKMPSTSKTKTVFMQFLKSIREVAAKFYMIDEAIFFCSRTKEMWLIFRAFGKTNN